MNKNLGLQLVVYSLLLAGLSSLCHYLAPALARPALIAGLVGGALALILGLRAMAGSQSKALPLLTLIPVSFVLLSQTVMAWSATRGETAAAPSGAIVLTLALVISIGMLMRIAYAGNAFDHGPAQAKKTMGSR
jgi:hypothetical protein